MRCEITNTGLYRFTELNPHLIDIRSDQDFDPPPLSDPTRKWAVRIAWGIVLTHSPRAAAFLAFQWDDDSDSPYALQLTPDSFNMLPAEPPAGRTWVVSAWSEGGKLSEWTCRRRSKSLPDLTPWAGG